VVGDEEVFATVLQYFPAARYLVLFAVGPAEAMILCESHSPRLMVVPLSGGGAELTSALRAVDHSGGKILGLNDPRLGVGSPHVTDKDVSIDDPDGMVEAARELLRERRQHPRVVVEFPVWFGANRQGLARDLSKQSLVIETTERLAPGEHLKLELHWGEAPRTISATVDRVRPADMGRSLATLIVPKEDKAARAYLGEVVRKILEVEHFLHALQPGRLAVRGRAAWNLARRAEASLKKTPELGLSAKAPPSPKGQAAQPPASIVTPSAPRITLANRYDLGPSRGRWGVGEVREARHRLLQRPLLVKQLADELRQDPGARVRMEAEATAASAVRSECVADVLDFGDDGEGGLFYAMEWLEGETLAKAISGRKAFSVVDVERLGVHLAFALTVSHRQRVRHWDLCPENVFLSCPDGARATPKLLALAGPPDAALEPPAYAMGIAFRPPGQSEALPSAQWDIFALCRMLGRIQAADSASSQGERLKALLVRGTSSDASRRFESMSSLCRALHQVLEDAEQSQQNGPDARIVPAVLPEDANIFRMSSTGLPIQRDPPSQVSWPRPPSKAEHFKGGEGTRPAGLPTRKPADRLDEKLAQEPAEKPADRLDEKLAQEPAEKPADRIADMAIMRPPVEPPSRHDPKPPSLKKTLYGGISAQHRPLEAAKGLSGHASTAAPVHPVASGSATATQPSLPSLPSATRSPAPPPLPSHAPSPAPPQARSPAEIIASAISEAQSTAPTPEAADSIPDGQEPIVVESPASSSVGTIGIPSAQRSAAPPRHSRLRFFLGIGAFALLGAGIGLWVGLLAREAIQKPGSQTAPRGTVTQAPGPGRGIEPKDRSGSSIQGGQPRESSTPARVGPGEVGHPDASMPAPDNAAMPGGAIPREADPKGGSEREAGPMDGSGGEAGPMDVPERKADPIERAEGAREPPTDEPPEDVNLSPREREERAKRRRLEARLVLINKARTLMRQGRHPEARKFLTDALKMWDSPRLRTLFAQSYSERGEHWPAIHHQRLAVAQSAGSVTQQIALGQLYLKVKQRGRACAAFRAARASKPTHAQVQTLVKRHCGT
jgi:serine/threonine protein kinase